MSEAQVENDEEELTKDDLTDLDWMIIQEFTRKILGPRHEVTRPEPKKAPQETN